MIFFKWGKYHGLNKTSTFCCTWSLKITASKIFPIYYDNRTYHQFFLNIKITINVMKIYSVDLRVNSTYEGNKSIAFWLLISLHVSL